MGAEASCTVNFNGQIATGTALLETEELLFRPLRGSGEFRLKISFVSIQEVEASEGVLRVKWPGGEARFELGANAATRWAEKIHNPKGRVEKLGVKEGSKVTLMGVRDATLAEELRHGGAEVTTGRPRKGCDHLFVAIDEKEGLSRLEMLKKYLAPAGALWVIRPKGAAAVTEKDVLAAGRAAGLVDVKVVKLSATHTAEKLVIPVAKRGR